MGEVFPVVGGALVGAAGLGISSRWIRVAWIAVMSIAFGLVATLTNGEELFLIPIDVGIAGLCAGAVTAAAPRLRRRAARRAAPSSADSYVGPEGTR